MPSLSSLSVPLSQAAARRLWLRAQRLDAPEPFGAGPAAVRAAVEHLGYVQIDTINVVERCHHHILWNRIPAYRREDLRTAQSVDKSVFEYWTHALSYVPTRDLRYFLPAMRRHKASPSPWYRSVSRKDLRRVLALIEAGGALTIRDIDDDVLVEKDHAWASRKPSKRALQLAFYAGDLAISERTGMLKTYELLDRHFGWEARPRAASEREIGAYVLDRALQAQGIVSLDSICYLDAGRKPLVRALIEARVARRRLRPVTVDGVEKTEFWAEPAALDQPLDPLDGRAHVLSPFDPLVIQRGRLEQLFGYAHRFEAYVPKEKRRLGYFALPVLVGDAVVAAIDAKADRGAGSLLIQQWTWIGDGSARHKPAVEEALHRFEAFQFRP